MTDKALLEAVRELTARTEDFKTEVAGARADAANVGAFGQRTRRRVSLVTWILIIDLIWTLVLAGYGVVIRNVSIEARAATTASRIAANNLKVICKASNKSGAQTKELWFGLLKIPKPPPGETPAQAKRRQDRAVNAYLLATTPPGETPAVKAKRIKGTREFVADVNRIYAAQDCDEGRAR